MYHVLCLQSFNADCTLQLAVCRRRKHANVIIIWCVRIGLSLTLMLNVFPVRLPVALLSCPQQVNTKPIEFAIYLKAASTSDIYA